MLGLGLGVHPGWAVVSLAAVAATGAWREVVLIALPEELLFRGAVQGEVTRRTRSTWIAVAVAAAAFALAHAAVRGDARALLTFFPGLLFGAIRAVSGSTWPAVAAHAVGNMWWLDASRGGFSDLALR